MRKFVLVAAFLASLFIVCVNSSKLNVPRVLLPVFNDHASSYLLEASEGGCYKWSTTRPNIIKLTLVDKEKNYDCAPKAIVSTVTKEWGRSTAMVLVEDDTTGIILKCDVIVDVIDHLNVKTKTRDIFIGEAPELFEIRAFDNQGNEFSTMEGVQFDWTIVSLGANKDAQVVRIMPFSSYTYEAPQHILALETKNKKGSMALLEGVKTGSAKVRICMPYREYKKIPQFEVQLTIMANIIIQPAEVFMLVGDYVQFKIFILRNGKMDEIKLPNSQYYLEIENTKIARTQTTNGQVAGMEIGATRMILRDKNIKQDELPAKFPTANIYVVAPSYIILQVLPYKNLAVIVGDKHEIEVEVYSGNDKLITLGQGAQIQVSVSEHFQIEGRSKNGSWLEGWLTKKGLGTVEATLSSVSNPNYGTFKLDNPIKAKAELMIFPVITISPPEVILPWDENIKPKYDVDLVANGGDGKFIWSSNDHSLAVVTQTGHVRTLGIGTFEISASMMRNHFNRKTCRFSIYPPVKLEIVEHVMETEIGKALYVNIALYALNPESKNDVPTYIPFTNCQKVPFQIKLSNDNFKHNKSSHIPPVGSSCANIGLVAFKDGVAKVTVSYLYDGKLMEDSATVSAYNPIMLLEPEREIVLAVGSSTNLVFTGGPVANIGKPSAHKVDLTLVDPLIVKAHDVTAEYSITLLDDYTVVRVTCQKLGTTDLTLKIYNGPTVPNCMSRSGCATATIICGKPRSVTLFPDIKLVDRSSCPMDIASDKFVVLGDRPVELEVVVKDDRGRVFLNTSSLLYEWTIDGLGKFKSKTGVFDRPHKLGSVQVAYKNIQEVTPSSESGTVKVSTKIIGYNMKVLEKQKIVPEWPEFLTDQERDQGQLPPITAAITLVLVQNTIVTPSEVSMYNNPAFSQIIQITQGSGFFELALSSDELAKVTYHEKSKEIEILPLKQGELKIQVNDLCLGATPAIVLVNIITVGIIRVEMADKVEIGKCIDCVVRLYDEQDNLMLMTDVHVIDLQHKLSSQIASFQRITHRNGLDLPAGEVHYIITGVELGDAQLTFSVSNGFDEVNSAPFDFQVFPPLKIYPRNGTLIVGANLQLSTKGGPRPEDRIEFSVEPSSYATVSKKGIITGLHLGQFQVTAKAIGIHPSTGKKVLYSEDKSMMKIVDLSGIKIAAPLTRFKVGSQVPVWVSGIPEQISPIVLGTMENPEIAFEWIVSDPEVAQVNSTFSPINIDYRKRDLVAVTLIGLIPGKTRLSLNVTIKGNKTSGREPVKYTSVINVEVFEGLELVYPEGLLSTVLRLAPFASIQLRTNLQSQLVEYYLPGESDADSKDLAVVNNIISVTKSGYLASLGDSGTAMIIVKSTDELGLVQRISVVVEIKPVHYMKLNVFSKWFINSSLIQTTLPVGATFDLRTTFHDNVGNQFHAGPNELMVRTSRCDLVKVKQGPNNDTMQVSLKKPGRTVIKVWADGIQKTADYVLINAEAVILPQNLEHVTRGDIICFFTPLLTHKGKHGQWLSTDRFLINIIDQRLAIAKVIGNKEGIVILTHTLHPSAPIQVLTYPVSYIQLDADPKMVITDAADPVFTIGVVLQSDKSYDKKTSNLIKGWNCQKDVMLLVEDFSFKCFMRFVNSTLPDHAISVFELKPGYVKATGQYACQITTRMPRIADVSTLQTDIEVWTESIDDENVLSDKVKVTFLPVPLIPAQIYIPESTVAELIILGLPQVVKCVTVQAEDKNILSVDKITSDDDNTVKFTVQLVDYHWKLAEIPDTLSLIVDVPAVNYTTRVKVNVGDNVKDGQRCDALKSPLAKFISTYKHSIILVATMMAIFISTFYVYSTYLTPVVNVNVRNQSLLGGTKGLAPITKICTTPANCTCSPVNTTGEPVYGDVSSFYNTSPDLRRNRRFL